MEAAFQLPGTRHIVAKANLGTKRVCPNCGSKYYDLNHSPIICPKCGTRAADVPLRPPLAAGAHPAKAPIPRIGKIFIAAVLLGILLIAAGFLGHNVKLAYAGVGLLGTFVLITLAGDLLS